MTTRNPSSTEMYAEVVQLDGSLARDLLGRNVKNRPQKATAIQRYAEDMVGGRWKLTGEAIKLDKDGHLLDGQNRCQALLLACDIAKRPITIPIMLIWNVDPESQDAMDGNVRRSVGDQFAMRGVPKYAKMAAAVRLVAMYDDDRLIKERTASRMQLIALYESDAAFFQECNGQEVDAHNSSSINASVRTAGRYILLRRANADPEAVDEFFLRLGTGVNLGAGDPILALRTRMTSARFNNETIRNGLSLVLLLRAWNAWRKGELIHKMPIRNPKGGVILPGNLVP